MPIDFTPINELERRLIAAQEGQIPPEAFIETLISSEVFMPVCERQRTGGPPSARTAQPLKIPGEDGEEVLVLFTSPERAKGFVTDYPGYGSGLVAELSSILERLGVGYTISLNPGHPMGLDFEAQIAARYASPLRPH